MKGTLNPGRNQGSARGGYALLSMVFAVFAAASLAAILTSMAATANRHAEVRRHSLQAEYLAEGAVEEVLSQLRVLILDGRTPEPAMTVNIGGVDVSCTIEALSPTQQTFDDGGLYSFQTSYMVEAAANAFGAHGRARRIVNANVTPIFQFAIFYGNDLELWPGPDMTLRGRVHTNGNLYLGAGSNLDVDTNYVRTAGDFFTRRKHSTDVNDGAINIRRWVVDPFDAGETKEFVKVPTLTDLLTDGVISFSGYDSDFAGHDDDGDGDYYGSDDVLPFGPGALEMWSQPDFYVDGTGNTLQTQEHGITATTLPSVTSLAMFEETDGGDYAWNATADRYMPVASGEGTHSKGPFHEDADLTILTHTDGTWVAYDGTGTNITSDLSGVVTLGKLYDNRQAENGSEKIDITTIDVAALNASGHFPANGLIYAATYGAGEGTDVKGIELTNGAELQSGLTVATENSIYIRGDYNTVNKKPASVITDALNLLSNAWDNSKELGDLPGAADTTYNVAIVTGNTESTATGYYNGGVENLPRFHEDWQKDGDKVCTLNGSLVALWVSKYANAPHTGTVRVPPVRDWAYDEAFNQSANLPPFTPIFGTVESVVSW